jgi:predicted DNA-binding transcriptional regulator AlpA
VKPKKILRNSVAIDRLGCSRTTFWESYVATGRIRLVKLGPKSRGVVESELDALIEELCADRLPAQAGDPIRKHEGQ